MERYFALPLWRPPNADSGPPTPPSSEPPLTANGNLVPPTPCFLDEDDDDSDKEETPSPEEEGQLLKAVLRNLTHNGADEEEPSREEFGELFYPYVRGKLSVLLGLGLSHREAANWTNSHHRISDALAQGNKYFAGDARKCRLLARMYPLLRVYMKSAGSWRAAAWLNRFLSRRAGTASLDEALAHMAKTFHKLHPKLFDEEAPPAKVSKDDPPNDRDALEK